MREPLTRWCLGACLVAFLVTIIMPEPWSTGGLIACLLAGAVGLLAEWSACFDCDSGSGSDR